MHDDRDPAADLPPEPGLLPEPLPASEPPAGEPADRPGVPWSGAEILVAVFLIYGVWGSLAHEFLTRSGWFAHLYGVDAPAAALEPALRTRLTLWVLALAFPFQVLTIPLLFRLASGTRPEQLGLTARRWRSNALAGVLAWLMLTPLVYLLSFTVLMLLGKTTGASEHPLIQLAQRGLSPTEWGLLLFVTTVWAPLLEEVVFRGAVQPWLARRPWGGAEALALAAVVALLARADQLQQVAFGDLQQAAEALAPLLFILALVPLYLFVRRGPDALADGAVFGTATLFAAVHSFAWPSPVPLFLLGVGLGRLAQRSGSLVGPIVLHGLFNSGTCLFLLLSQAGRGGG